VFDVGARVVDRQMFAEGHAAVGIVRSSTGTTVLVEWPDGIQENVQVEELQPES